MEKKTTPSNQKGFTLIELMIVIAIIGILATIAVPNYQRYILQAEAVVLVSKIKFIKTALETIKISDEKYPEFEHANAGKVPDALKGFLSDEIFNGPDTIVIRLRTGSPKAFRSDIGFVEENEPYLVIGSGTYGKADKLLITLQHMVGPDKFTFYMDHSWAKMKLM